MLSNKEITAIRAEYKVLVEDFQVMPFHVPEVIVSLVNRIPALLDALEEADAVIVSHGELIEHIDAERRCLAARYAALERAVIWNGSYCALCVNRYKSCPRNKDCPGFEFDEARFVSEGGAE